MPSQQPIAPRAAPITVVMPAYNARAFIAEALGSVLDQTLPPAEVVVVDDGSSDDTGSIAEALGARVVRQENRGLSAARNAGIRAARHEWIALLDSDDVWEPSKLERQWEAVEHCPDAAFITCDHLQFSDDVVIRPSFLARPEIGFDRRNKQHPAPGVAYFPTTDDNFWGMGQFMLPSTILVRRDLIVSAGLFDETFRFGEDIECVMRLLAHGGLAIIEEPLLRYRLHDANYSKGNELAIVLSLIGATERMQAMPHMYAPGAGVVWASSLPEKQLIAGRLLLDRGRAREARNLLAASLHRRRSARALALYFVAALGGLGFRWLLAVKRSLGALSSSR